MANAGQRRDLVALAICLLAGSCAGPSDAPNRPLAGFAGSWSGTTAQSLPVRIRVNEARPTIDTLAVRISAAFGSLACAGTVVRTDVPINADSTFETSVGIGFTVALRGRFTSANSVQGVIDEYAGDFGVLCGTMAFVGNGRVWSEVQWGAHKP